MTCLFADPSIYTSKAVASALVAYLGVARPQGASVGNKLSRGLSSSRRTPVIIA